MSWLCTVSRLHLTSSPFGNFPNTLQCLPISFQCSVTTIQRRDPTTGHRTLQLPSLTNWLQLFFCFTGVHTHLDNQNTPLVVPNNNNRNKAISNSRLRSRVHNSVAPPGESQGIICCRLQAYICTWPIIWKHDIIHKTGNTYLVVIVHCRQRTELWQQVTHTEIL